MGDDYYLERDLERGIITLSGGRDIRGNTILTISTNKLTELAEYQVKDLAAVILHLATISKYLKSKDNAASSSQSLPLACVADLRHASTQAIKQLIDSLEYVEHQHRGTINVVYFLKPRTKTKSHILKKLLGVKPSKKRPRVPLFKVELMKTLQELYTHVDVSQLTLDFSGTIQYNHNAWMHLYNVVIKCIEGCEDMLAKLPGVRDKVDLLQEYETDGQSSSQVQQLLADLMEKFHDIISESSLPLCLTQSKQTLFLLDHPASDTQLSSVHPELVKGLRSHLGDLYTKLDTWNRDLEETWRITENRLTILIQVHRHRERAQEIERKIREYYHPLLREHLIVGKTLSQAELYRAHFTTTLYDPAKDLLSQATEVLEAVQKLKKGALPGFSGVHSDSAGSTNPSFVSGLDISDITQCLTTSIQPFTTQLQQLQQLYVSIHIFHLLFEKALAWYKKVLKFLPETLLQRCTTDTAQPPSHPTMHNLTPQTREGLVYMPTEWLGAVRVFLSRHPSPRQEHIDRLDENIPQLVDRKLKAQARSLALRLRLLQRVLSSARLPLRLLTAVVAWRVELFGSSQQEKSPTSVMPDTTFRDRKKVGFSQSRRNSMGDFTENQESVWKDGQAPPHKHHASRLHEKNPRGRKSATFDPNMISVEKPVHPNTSKSTSGPSTTSEELRVQEKLPVRKIGPRVIARSKSVEFNFNSSSTDGSVFDYDKALVQAESGPETGRPRAIPRIPRKSRSLMKDAKPVSYQRFDLKAPQTEERAFSDPSEMLQQRVNWAPDDQAPPRYREKVQAKEYTIKAGSDGTISSTPEQMNPKLPVSLFPQHEEGQQHHHPRYKKKPAPLHPGVAASANNEERFIRVTFTPKQIQANSSPVFRFGSVDNLNEDMGDDKDYNFEQDDESGIETAEGADPYDNVVQKIREISASSLTNMEKLKQVSELLSSSALKRSDSKRFTEELRASKLSFSTLDLRPKSDLSSDTEMGMRLKHLPQNINSRRAERPVDTVQRMKRNLAKSMEELQNITSYPVEYSHQINQPYHQSAESKSSTLPGNQDGKRYISELKIQPTYMKPKDTVKQITVLKLDRQNYSASDVETHQRTSLPQIEESSKPRSLSDVESVSPAVGESHDSLYTHGMDYRDIPHLSQGDAFQEQGELFPSASKKAPAFRPSSLALFSNRNFISPSFLRPASSMKDLSARGHPELAVAFTYDMDLDTEYQALEDLEMLRTLQEDPLSNEFSKYVPASERRMQRRKSSENFSVKQKAEHAKSDSLHSSDPASQEASPSKTTFPGQASGHLDTVNQQNVTQWDHLPTVSRQGHEELPQIHVGYALDNRRSLNPDENVEDDVPYNLNIHDPNFDRLTSEADQEFLSQEEVADSLRKTQMMLEKEESRRYQRLHDEMSDSPEDEGERAGDGARRLSQNASLDNGYGSWASKLLSARSTSSEGAGPDQDSLYSQDWRKLSSSSADSATKSKYGWNKGSSRDRASRNRDDDDGDDAEEDTLASLPWFEKPLTDPDLY